MDFSAGIIQVAPGGLALVQRTDIPSNKSTWYLLNAPAGTLLPLPLHRRFTGPSYPTCQTMARKRTTNYIVAWSPDSGSGSRRIPRGSSVEAAAVDPSARYVAISTITTLSIGSVRDSVVVLQTSDGKEVFRRFLPKYNRTNVSLEP
jgi:hypothetical protein